MYAYYASGKIIKGLSDDNHLIARAKSNAVAYCPFVQTGVRKHQGRPRTYGPKRALKSLYDDPSAMISAASPAYGEEQVSLAYRVSDLLWRPAGRYRLARHAPLPGFLLPKAGLVLLRIVAENHPPRYRLWVRILDS